MKSSMKQHKARLYRTLYEYGLVLLGASLVGFGYNLFLLPAKLAAGGLSGISTLLFEVYGFSPAFVQFLFNIPILIIGWIVLGNDFRDRRSTRLNSSHVALSYAVFCLKKHH